jgi:molecular chaperone DnaK (HSP70)
MTLYRYFVSLAISSGEAPNPKVAYTNAVVTLEVHPTALSTLEVRAIEERFLLQFAHQGASAASLICIEPLDVHPISGGSDILHAHISVVMTMTGKRPIWKADVFRLHVPIKTLGTIQIREIENGFEQAHELEGVEQATVVGLRLLSCVSMDTTEQPRI